MIEEPRTEVFNRVEWRQDARSDWQSCHTERHLTEQGALSYAAHRNRTSRDGQYRAVTITTTTTRKVLQ